MNASKPGKGWQRALERVAVGDDLRGLAQLDRIEREGRFPALVYVRIKSGKELRVTAAMLNRVWAATARGGRLERRKNGPTGISYTVAVEAAVVAALGLVEDKDRRWRRG